MSVTHGELSKRDTSIAVCAQCTQPPQVIHIWRCSQGAVRTTCTMGTCFVWSNQSAGDSTHEHHSRFVGWRDLLLSVSLLTNQTSRDPKTINYMTDKHKNTVCASHSLTVLSSDAVARYLLSHDHATSDIPCACPDSVSSNAPSSAFQIFT